MQKHTKNYLKYFGYWEQSWIPCELCSSTATDIHHILYRSQWWWDDILNLVWLCRKCHDKAHAWDYDAEYLTDKHLQFMQRKATM